jgi:chemotaxis protein CheD
LWHALLPDSTIDEKRAMNHPGMFLDTGLAELLKRTEELDAKRENLMVFAAGGGRILDETGCFNLGPHNHEVLMGLLAQNGLKIRAENVGGRVNRTMQLNLATGETRLKISGQPKTTILCKP